MPLQIRRGSTADRILITPVIGELIFDTVEKVLYVGDGTTPGGVAASSFSFEDAQDAAAALFTSSASPNIAFSYNDEAGRIDANLNLTNYNGIITADGFKGSLFADDSNLLIDGVLGSFQLDGTVRSNIVPFSSEIYDLGSPTNKFRDLYLSGNSLYLGDAQITANGTAVNLPAGSTIGGSSIASSVGDGLFEGDIKGSVFGQDSSILIDATNNRIVGDIDARLGNDLDVNGYRLVGNDIFLAPLNTVTVGSLSLNRNGNIIINRYSFNGLSTSGSTGFLITQTYNDSRADAMEFYKSRGTPSARLPVQAFDVIGELRFIGETTVGLFNQPSAAIRVSVDGPVVGSTAPGRIEFFTNNGVSGFIRKARLTANGVFEVDTIRGLVAGLSITGDLTGSVFSDNSTRIIDGTDGSITAGSFVQFGSLTASERNSLTAVNGMVIYNTTYNRFEGYQNGAWINLDDGTTAGV